MRTIFLFVFVWLNVWAAKSQNLENLSFGENQTFEIATWNIEWFPKNGTATMDSVQKIIEQLDIDFWACQEIEDTIALQQMVENLDGYATYFKSSWFAGLAYIYKKEALQINDFYEIYETAPYWGIFPRAPMIADITVGGERIFIINNHYKCCGDNILDLNDNTDEENRRLTSNELLKDYIETNLPDENVILLGDLNDLLTDPASSNVFLEFLTNTSSYKFVDRTIANSNSAHWSYPNWPSHLDHILITNELFDEFAKPNSDIQTLRIDDYYANGLIGYDYNISDHRPVVLKLDLDGVIQNVSSIEGTPSFSIHPNPATQNVYIKTSINNDYQLTLLTLEGKMIQITKNTPVLDIEKYPKGLYLLEYKDLKTGKISSQKLILE